MGGSIQSVDNCSVDIKGGLIYSWELQGPDPLDCGSVDRVTRVSNKGGGCDIKRRLWISWEPAPPPSPALNLTSHPAGGEPTAV